MSSPSYLRTSLRNVYASIPSCVAAVSKHIPLNYEVVVSTLSVVWVGIAQLPSAAVVSYCCCSTDLIIKGPRRTRDYKLLLRFFCDMP